MSYSVLYVKHVGAICPDVDLFKLRLSLCLLQANATLKPGSTWLFAAPIANAHSPATFAACACSSCAWCLQDLQLWHSQATEGIANGADAHPLAQVIAQLLAPKA